jgi:murein L,D-transpeptidase YafK
MILPLLLAALVSTPSRDSSLSRTMIATPTVSRTPATAIGDILHADSIVVEKQRRTMTLYNSGVAVRSYQIALGKEPTGDKMRIGDNRTPEGVFHIDARNPQSKYHKALHISYPDAEHIQKAKALGFAAGGDIMIHGLPPAYADLGVKHRDYDWTNGCIAVTDQEIEEIWRAVPNGAAIQIKP